MTTALIQQSRHLRNTHYELRGKVAKMAVDLESQGKTILKCHLGNPGLFGLHAHEDLTRAVQENLIPAQAYCDSAGLLEAREAILSDWHNKALPTTQVDQIMLGNGVSELINAVLQALLNPGDEVLLPQPVYPLWSAATTACCGRVRFYRCDEQTGWLPDVDHMAQQISSKTKAVVVINPNNPTGAIYPPAVLESIGRLAAQHQLVVFADEIYSDIVFDQQPFYHMADYSQETLTITFDGLSKNYLLAGYRCAWMVCSGQCAIAEDYLNGVRKLLSMRLCANVPSQYAVAPALSNPQYKLLSRYPEFQQRRDQVVAAINQVPGLSCHMPAGAFYLYPAWDEEYCDWQQDGEWALSFLQRHCILFAPGSTFAQPDQRHFRMVLLPEPSVLLQAVDCLAQDAVRLQVK